MKRFAVWGLLGTDVGREGSPEAIIARCKRTGIDTYLAYVYPLESGSYLRPIPYFAYASKEFVDDSRDLLGPLLREGRRAQVTVEPWLLGFRSHLMRGEREEEVAARTYQPLIGEDGKDAAGFAHGGKRICPTWPENRARAVRMLRDYLAVYGGDLTGIHLDYMRYGDAGTCFKAPCHCDACRKEYRAAIGTDTLTAEDLAVPGVLYRFVQFRNRCIRELAEEIRDITRKAGLRLSLAARVQFFDYALVEGQDWPGWIRDGLLDAVYLMNYSTIREEHLERIRRGVSLIPRARATVFCDGVGKKSSAGENTTENMIAYARDALAAGADGISVYHYDGLKDEDFDALRRLKEERA